MQTGVRYADVRGRVDRVYPDRPTDWPPFTPWCRPWVVEPAQPVPSRPAHSGRGDGPAEQWDLLRRRLRLLRQPPRDRASVREMIRAYEEATGTGVYCD